ncbi:MAG: BON domain-containing protein [Candidatus Sericytochromatia bacterium]|nr:BON domain-containing protein [Candidatus Sericytochromatia bacterium]
MATSTRAQTLRDQLQQALTRQLGLSDVRIDITGQTLRLSGEVAHAGEQRRAAELARQMAPELRIDARLSVSQDGRDRDEALQIAAMQALDEHNELADQQMAVVVEGTVARLIGMVSRYSLMGEAVALCRRIPGITAVETADLESSGPSTAADSATTRLEAALALDPRLEATGLAVTVKDGIAQVSGAVRQASERVAAVEIAAAQTEVHRAICRITVAGTDAAEDEMLAAALQPQLPPGCHVWVCDGIAYLFGTLSADDQQIAEAVTLTTLARVVSLIRPESPTE